MSRTPNFSKPAGLQYDKKTSQWSIDKRIKGYGRLRERLQASSEEEATMKFLNRISEIKLATDRDRDCFMTFTEAGIRYVEQEAYKRSIDRDICCLETLAPFIGHLPLSHVHDLTLQAYIESRKQAGIKSGTVNRELAVVRNILNLSARSWRNSEGRPYLTTPPMIKRFDWEDGKKAYPLDGVQQRKLLRNLPKHLRTMALFAVNTGLRDQGICKLRWDWEINIPELNTSYFLTPGRPVDYENIHWAGEKNKFDQIVVLNRVAKKIIEIQRKNRVPGCPWVFPHEDAPLDKMNNDAWQKAWKDAGLPVDALYMRGPHNLKHSFGRRLIAAKVPKEIRKDLLHHTTIDVTDVYSYADFQLLIEAAEKVVHHKSFLILRRSN